MQVNVVNMEERLDPLLEVSGNALRPGLVFTETTSIISNLYFFVTCIQEPNLVDKNLYFAEIPSLVHSSARDSFLRQWSEGTHARFAFDTH